MIINKKNLGYGGNIKKCISYAIKNNFDYAVMIHGDGQYSPKYIKSLVKILLKNNFLHQLAHDLKVSQERNFWWHANLQIDRQYIFNKIFNFVFNTNFKDAHTGLWAYKINLFKKIKLKSLPNSFNFDQKIRISLIKNNLKIKEIPIQTIYADERSQLHIIYAIKFFLITLFYFLRLNYFFNK